MINKLCEIIGLFTAPTFLFNDPHDIPRFGRLGFLLRDFAAED